LCCSWPGRRVFRIDTKSLGTDCCVTLINNWVFPQPRPTGKAAGPPLALGRLEWTFAQDVCTKHTLIRLGLQYGAKSLRFRRHADLEPKPRGPSGVNSASLICSAPVALSQTGLEDAHDATGNAICPER
jgi:hypothetical protein